MWNSRASHGQPAAQGVILLSLASAAAVLLGYGVHVVAARWLTPVSYGRFVIVVSVIALIKNLQGSLLLPGLFKSVSEDHRRLGAALGVAVRWYSAASIGLLVLVLIAAPVLGLAFGDAALMGLFMLAAIELPFSAMMNLGDRLLKGLRRYGVVATMMATYSVTRTCGACVLILLGVGVAGGVVGLALGSIVAGALAFFLLVRERKLMPSEPYPPMLRRALSWTAMAIPTVSARAALMAMDLWMVKAMMDDPVAAGLYGVAYTVSRLPHFITQGLVGAVFPRVSGALAEGSNALARSVSAEAMRLLIIVFVPICVLVAGSASEIAAFLFSAKYAGAGAPLSLLIISMSCSAYLSLMLALIAAADHPGVRMAVVVALLPVGAGLNLLLIPRLGLEGAATASLITLGLGAVIAGLLAYSYVRAVPPLWSCLRCVTAGGVVYAMGRAWAPTGWSVIGKLAALGTLYLVVLFLLREFQKEDLSVIRRAILRSSASPGSAPSRADG
ncbi:MAG: polysaccharide biosynthesis C-terminal domain-containing protein [Phycisphaerae bacterium]